MVDKKKKFLKAGFWVMLVFGLSQVIRLGSNLIVTRLLEPELFGVMAIVYVVTGGIGMLSDLGLWAFVVRHKDPTNTHMLNVVWTIQVIRGWIIFFGILLAGIGLTLGNQYAPQYFSGIYTDTRLPLLIIVAGITSILSGYKSLASAVVSRELQVGKLEAIDFICQAVSTAIMLIWVWIHPTIWALVSSSIISALISTILSFTLFPYRHKLAWDKAIVKEVFHFGRWIVISSALTYIFLQGDKLFLGGKITATEMGIYTIALMLANLPIAITHTLAAKIIFPFLSSVVHEDRSLLKARYYKIRTYLDGATFLCVGILIALAPFIIHTLYDARYAEAGWMLQILAFSVVGYSLSATSVECLSALSITKVNMWVMIVRTAGLFIGLPLFFKLYGLYGAIWVITLNPLLALPVIYWTLTKNHVFSLIKELRMLVVIPVGYYLGEAGLALLNLN